MAVKVLLTGATGFIGSHVAKKLVADGDHVSAIIKPSSNRSRIREIEDRLRIIECDMADRASVAASIGSDTPDVCIHLAWRGWSGPSLTAEENLSSLAASLELLRAVANSGCRRFIGVGTCFEYDTSVGAPLSESTPTVPKDLYGVCKHALCTAAFALGPIANIEVAWARVFLVYGPYDDARRLVPSLALSLIRGEQALTTAGEQVRDVLHVEDAATAIVAIARSRYVGPVTVASGIPVKVRTIANEIAEIAGRPDLLRLGALPYRAQEPAALVADTSVLRDQIGWVPRHNLSTGLADTVSWWRAHAAAFQSIG